MRRTVSNPSKLTEFEMAIGDARSNASLAAIRPQRALVGDLPVRRPTDSVFGHSRQLALVALSELAAAGPRISWPALFLKAYGRPPAEIRTASLYAGPPHIYGIRSRRLPGREPPRRRATAASLGAFRQLQEPPFVQLQQNDAAQHEPVEQQFKRQRRASRFPASFAASAGKPRCNFPTSASPTAGTFGLTTLAGQGVEIDRPPSVATSTFTYGPLTTPGDRG